MKSLRILIVFLIAIGAAWLAIIPAQAQLGAGCTCPAGFTHVGLKCLGPGAVLVPAICTGPAMNQSIGHVAASQQQLSFTGVEAILQQRRDQLQGTPAGHGASSRISGYLSSDLDADTDALGYVSQSKKANPLASLVDKAASPSAPAGPNWAVWVQGLGNWEHDGALAPTDIAHFTNTYTAQTGIDGTWQGLMSSNDALVLGIVSSSTASHVTYNNMPTTMQMMGPGVGVYGTYVKGGFSTDLTTKFDFLQINQDLAGAAPNTSVAITNAGVSGNAQYKFTGAANNFFEPTAGFSFTRTIFGSGATPDMQDSSTLRLQAGARLGTTWEIKDVSIDASFKALVYGNAVVTGTSVQASAFGSAIAPTDEGKVRGELDPELCFNLADGYSVSLSGTVIFGDALVGGSAGINIRKQW